MKQGKIWGDTELIYSGNNVEVHRINVVPGGYCSVHYHQSKYNEFYIESGSLTVEIYNENGKIDKSVLTEGQKTTVPPLVKHKFITTEETTALEIYYATLDKDDIIRKTVGGVTGG